MRGARNATRGHPCHLPCLRFACTYLIVLEITARPEVVDHAHASARNNFIAWQMSRRVQRSLWPAARNLSRLPFYFRPIDANSQRLSHCLLTRAAMPIDCAFYNGDFIAYLGNGSAYTASSVGAERKRMLDVIHVGRFANDWRVYFGINISASL